MSSQSGWGYLEHDWIATAGDWVYEAPGESHTLVAYECDEPMRVTFNVTGPLSGAGTELVRWSGVGGG